MCIVVQYGKSDLWALEMEQLLIELKEFKDIGVCFIVFRTKWKR